MSLRLIIFNFLVILAYSSSLKYDPLSNWKIVGGTVAPDGKYPYQISLQLYGRHACGGTIVHREWIITAAHCLQNSRNPEDYRVVTGSNKLSQIGDIYSVLEIHYHSEYNTGTLQNDVGILKVAPIEFNPKVAQIQVETEDIGGDVPVTLTGWGSAVAGGPIPDNLQQINLKTTTVEFCNQQRHIFPITDSQICTLTKAGEGACHGDSGGPLVQVKGQAFVLTGIVSWGNPCAKGVPDVFARVSSYIQWFNEKCNNCLNN